MSSWIKWESGMLDDRDDYYDWFAAIKYSDYIEEY